jgi:flavin reductase (DIM6/NTAB) family NADH-FMN oxidoreductase RutF
VVICVTKDKYQDPVVSAISSVVPGKLNENEILIESDSTNNLRKKSVIKVDRIVTVKSMDVIARIGALSEKQRDKFKKKFINLVESKVEGQEQAEAREQVEAGEEEQPPSSST